MIDSAFVIPSQVDKLSEDRKFSSDNASCSPVSSIHGGDHVFPLQGRMVEGLEPTPLP